MDNLKKETVKNFTEWDVNAKCVKRRAGERKKLATMFIRSARRANKQELRKEI